MSYYELKCQKCGKQYNSPNKNSIACVWCVKQIIREKHCLDKERVREAIKEVMGTMLGLHPYGEALLEKLNLEEE